MSLHDDALTEEKVRVNILVNPHTLFLAPTSATVEKIYEYVAPTSATVEKIYEYVLNTLFAKEDVIRYIINGHHIPMPIYKNI